MRGPLIFVLLLGCASDPPPTCLQATEHYYGAGCALISPLTFATLTFSDANNQCAGLAAHAPASCLDEIASLNACMASVPSPAKTAQCDCSAEQTAIISCS